MKIFIIKRDEYNKNYEEYYGHVVVANTTGEVLSLVKELGLENEQEWDKAALQEIGQYTGPNKEPFVVLSDYSGS